MEKFKNLRGRKVKADSKKEARLKLTEKEILLIQKAIDNYKNGDSYIKKINKRLHLDFIGWDNPEYNDVLVCLNKK